MIMQQPCKPRPLNLRGDDARPNLGGGVPEAPCFIVFFEAPHPLKLGGESSPPKFRG